MKKNQLQSVNRLYDGLDSRHSSLSKNAKKLLLITLILFSTTWAQAVTYYLTAAGAGAAQTPASWNTNPAGGGTPAVNFTTDTDIFNVPVGISGIVAGNIVFGNKHKGNMWLTIDGILTINNGITLSLQQLNAGVTTFTVNGSLIFLGTSANQLTATTYGNGSPTNINFTLSSGAILKTVNTSGIVAVTGTSSINSTNLTANLNTAANYEFNGAAQSTTGLRATVNNLTFSGTGSKTLVTPVQVNGIYSVENGSNVNTYTGTLTYGTNATLQYNSTGARTPGAEWVTPFTATGGVVIKNTGEITLATSKTVNLLTIAPSGKLTFNTNTLTVTTLNIQSDATGTGTYLGSGTLNATTTNVNQYLNTYRSWYITSPISGTVTPSPNAGSLSILRYLESANDDQTSGVSWLTSTTISPDQGYFVTPSGAGTTQITFTGSGSGSLNNGAKSFILTRNDHPGKSKNGFNLIGNPYPSYLEWQEVYTANISILSSPTMWYRTKDSGIYYFWTVNGPGGLGNPAQANDTIPPMQAFWVRTITDGGTLNLTNTMRVHNTAPTSNLLKAPKAKTAINQILRINVSNGTTTDETVVYFNTNAADGYDMYDSPKMINGTLSTVPDFYTSIGGEVLSINGMNNIPNDTVIPLYFVANASAGTFFTITANELSNFEPGTQVWIKNNLSGISRLISDGTPYTFDIAETGVNPKFSIYFKAPGISTNFVNLNKNNFFVFVNTDGQIAIKCNDEIANDATVTIYNNMGQLITKKTLTGSLTLIDKKMTSGVYIAKVSNAENKTTERIIIK